MGSGGCKKGIAMTRVRISYQLDFIPPTTFPPSMSLSGTNCCTSRCVCMQQDIVRPRRDCTVCQRHPHTLSHACVPWVSDTPSLHVNVWSLQTSCLGQFHHWIGQSASWGQEGNYPQKCLCSKSQFTFDVGLHHAGLQNDDPAGARRTCSISRFFSPKIPADPNLQSRLHFFPPQEYPFHQHVYNFSFSN